jgi:hypothetical protein
VNTDRTTATIVGVLYIVGTVAGFLSMVVTGGLLDAPDYLNVVAANASRAMLGALLVLVMGLALAMVPAMMFSILKRQNEALATGYVVFRGALETVTYIGVAICWLLLAVSPGSTRTPGPRPLPSSPVSGACWSKHRIRSWRSGRSCSASAP